MERGHSIYFPHFRPALFGAPPHPYTIWQLEEVPASGVVTVEAQQMEARHA